jgi:integrase/recombinase XerC
MKYQVEACPKTGSHRLVFAGKKVEVPNRFLEAIEVRGLSPKTVRAYAYDLLLLYRWLSVSRKSFRQLRQTELFEFISWDKKRGANPHSINRRLSVYRHFYRFSFGKDLPLGVRVASPSPYFAGPGRDRYLGIWRARRRDRLQLRVRAHRTIVEPLSQADVNQFFKTLSRYRDLSLTLLLLLCGLRSSEVLSLDVEDIDFLNERIRILGKGNKDRILPLPRRLADSLRSYIRLERPAQSKSRKFFLVLQGSRRGRPMTIAGLRSLFRHRRLAWAIPKANPHRWRHTFACDLARSGVRLPVLQRILGHANGTTTLQYVHLSMADINAEYQRVVSEIQKRYGALES